LASDGSKGGGLRERYILYIKNIFKEEESQRGERRKEGEHSPWSFGFQNGRRWGDRVRDRVRIVFGKW